MENNRVPIIVENKTRIEDHGRRIQLLEDAVFDIRDKLLQRPSWFVSIIITGLMTTVVSLLVYLTSVAMGK